MMYARFRWKHRYHFCPRRAWPGSFGVAALLVMLPQTGLAAEAASSSQLGNLSLEQPADLTMVERSVYGTVTWGF